MPTCRVDLYVAGPPCQPWSAAGQQRGLEDERGPLFWAALHFIRDARPKVAILENVPRLVAYRSGEFLAAVARDLEAYGYQVHWAILEPADHGIAQHRPRRFIVAIRTDAAVRSIPIKNQYHRIIIGLS